MEDNVAVINKLFELFGQGQIPAAMELFSDEVVFQSPVTKSKHKFVTWSSIRKNKHEIGTFFMELNQKIQLEKMQITQTTAQDDRVVVEGRNAGTVRSTGNRYDHEWVMIFTLKDGKIIRNAHYYDTADLEKAFN